MSGKTKLIGHCKQHGEFNMDAPDSPCPCCEDADTETKTQYTPYVLKGKYGWFVTWPEHDFVSAMPNEQTAKLAAAAPDLLEACHKVNNILNELISGGEQMNWATGESMLRAVQQAILKAEGN